MSAQSAWGFTACNPGNCLYRLLLPGTTRDCDCFYAFSSSWCRGNVLLHNVVLSGTRLSLQNCNATATLAVGASVGCVGTYSVLQSDIESGMLVIGASGSSPSLPQQAQVVTASTWDVPVDVSPQLAVDVEGPSCTQSGATSGGLVSCPVCVSNPGNLALSNIQLIAAAGTSVSECQVAPLAPSEDYTCTVTRQVHGRLGALLLCHSRPVLL